MRNRHTRFISTLLALLFIGAFSSAQDPQEDGFELTADGPVSFDQETNEIVATDGAKLRYGLYLLSADTIRYSNETGAATASGNVAFTQKDLRLIAETIYYDPANNYVRVGEFRAGNGRYYVEGSALEGDPNNFRFVGINFFPGEPGTFLFRAKADELSIIDQNIVKGKKLAFNLGNLPFLILPSISQPLDADANIFKIDADYSGHLGASIGGEFLIPVNDNLRLGANILPTSKRGILFGPAAQYDWGDLDSDTYANGYLSTGYIDDDADLVGLDARGFAIDDKRSFAEWTHVQRWNSRASIVANVHYWSDTEVTRDFHSYSVQDPDSYLEANYNFDDWQVSLFTRASPNDFQIYTERLPELKATLFPKQIHHGIYHNGYLSVAKLRGNNPTSSTEQDESDRADAYYGFDLYKPIANGLSLSANIGARATHYFEATTFTENVTPANRQLIPITGDLSGTSSYFASEGTRAYGDLGLDLKMQAFAQSNFKSESWDIDGIRHIFEPVLSYRYTPELDGDDAIISYIDRPTIANYLAPIDLEERRDTDTLVEEHKVRLELRNRIQTKSDDAFARNLARFSLSMDYLIDDHNTGDSISDLYSDFELTPAPWMAFSLFSRYDTEGGDLEEINTQFTLQDEGYWKVGIGNQFYRRLLEQYSIFGEYSLSENLKLYGVAKYDRETKTFNEQRIGLLQRAIENYAIKYEIVFYQGDRRESDFKIRIGIDLFSN